MGSLVSALEVFAPYHGRVELHPARPAPIEDKPLDGIDEAGHQRLLRTGHPVSQETEAAVVMSSTKSTASVEIRRKLRFSRRQIYGITEALTKCTTAGQRPTRNRSDGARNSATGNSFSRIRQDVAVSCSYPTDSTQLAGRRRPSVAFASSRMAPNRPKLVPLR